MPACFVLRCDNSNLISSVTVPVPEMNQFRRQNAFFCVDSELLCNFELLSSDSSEMENAIQLQGVLDLLKREA